MVEIIEKKIVCFARTTSSDDKIRIEGNVTLSPVTKKVTGYHLSALVNKSENETTEWSHAGDLNKDGQYNAYLNPEFRELDRQINELAYAVIDGVEAEYAD